jgi:tetratricopeptide (TPR) repeat protein
LDLLERSGADGSALAAPALGLAAAEGNRGDLQAALEWAREAERHFGDDVDGAANARTSQGRVLAQIGDTDAALAVLQQNVDTPGVDPGIVANSLRLAGRAHAIEMRTDEAIELLERARDLRIELHGPDHQQVGLIWSTLGWALLRANRLDDADRAYTRSEAIWRAVLPEDHPNIASALMDRARVLQLQQRYEEAEPLFREALDRFVAIHGPDNIDVGTAHNNLGLLYVEMGRAVKAERNLRAAVDTYGRALGSDHVFVGIAMQNLLKLYSDQGRLAEHRDDAERAHRLLAGRFGDDDFRAQLPRAVLAWLDRDLDELLAAEEILAEAGNDQTPRVRRMLADVYGRRGRAEEARAWRERAERFPED